MGDSDIQSSDGEKEVTQLQILTLLCKKVLITPLAFVHYNIVA